MDFKLSIITICYNQEKDVEQTCQSIVSQTFQDFEWIVIDGGSTDGTLKILEKYKNRMNVFISEPDKGRFNAMNKGIQISHGEWLNFMNGGDSFYSNKVLQSTFFNKKYPKSDVLYGKMLYRKENNDIMIDFPQKLNRKFFLRKNINHQSSFIRKSLFDTYGLYDEATEIFGDFEKWVCFINNNCVFTKLNFPVGIFKDDGISSLDDENSETFAQINEYKKKLIEKYYTKKEIEKNEYKEYHCEIYFLYVIPILFYNKLVYKNKTKILLFGSIPIMKYVHYEI